MKNFLKNIRVFAIIFVFLFLIFGIDKVNAYGECDQYGFMAMSDGLGSCQCMSGYSFGKDYMGQTSCISDTQLCTDKYGYNATADYSGSCKCRYGYFFGKDSLGRTQCVSLEDSCHDDLGYNSSYNSLSDQCECSYGYIIQGGKCVNGSNFCSSKQGLYSSYNTSSKKCECDIGYTLDSSSQCVEKQNNVYFIVKELDTENKQAIIKSDYDYSYYLISYSTGCYANSFQRYLNNQIVVNLGTDLYLDTWDKIVLQDDDETCDITHKEKVDSNTTLTKEQQIFYAPPKPVTQTKFVIPVSAPKVDQKLVIIPEEKKVEAKEEVEIKTDTPVVPTFELKSSATTNNVSSKTSWYIRFFNWLF